MTATDRPDPKKPHHHGDLRAALIQAGIELLSEGGPGALTLRRCAARVGVSHAAPAHHFDGLAGLRAAIAMEGMQIFRAAMLDEAAKGAQTPRDRLHGICRGYLAFARANRALFHIMFGFELQGMHHAGLERETAVAYDVLRATCAPFIPPGQDRAVVETQVWSLIHGYTSLALSGRFQRDDADGATTLFSQVMALLDRIGRDPDS